MAPRWVRARDRAAAARRRVVVTGIGPVTPVGIGVDAFWSALTQGRGGITRIQNFDASGPPGADRRRDPRLRARDVHGPQGGEAHRPRGPLRRRRGAASRGRTPASRRSTRARTAVMFSTGIGGLGQPAQAAPDVPGEGPRPGEPVHGAAAHAERLGRARRHGLRVHRAQRVHHHRLRRGRPRRRRGVPADPRRDGRRVHRRRDRGIGAPADALGVRADAGARRGTPIRRPPRRPFDKDRDGFVLSEGACALVLEEAERAVARGATHLRRDRRLRGHRPTRTTSPRPSPKGSGPCGAMAAALEDAGEPPDAVDYINAHGTSTELNDAAETRAIKKALGDHAAPGRGLLDQVDDRPHAGRRGRRRGAVILRWRSARRHPAHHQLPDARPRVRPGLRPERGAHGRGPLRAVELVRVRRAERRGRGAPLRGLAGPHGLVVLSRRTGPARARPTRASRCRGSGCR